MSALRRLIAATTNDAISAEDIRNVEVPSVVQLAASCVTLTDTIGLRLDKTIIKDDSLCNIHAAALSLVNIPDDVVVMETVVGPGTLRIPCTVGTSLIFDLQVNPIL